MRRILKQEMKRPGVAQLLAVYLLLIGRTSCIFKDPPFRHLSGRLKLRVRRVRRHKFNKDSSLEQLDAELGGRHGPWADE